MKIRTKMMSLLGLLFAVLLLLDIAIQKQVLLPSFAELEQDTAKTSMKRIGNALNLTLDTIQLSAADWGNWADVYRFALVRNQDFIDTNISASALKQLQVNLLMIVDLNGRVVVNAARDLGTGAPLELGFGADGALPPAFPWRTHLAEGRPEKGLVRTNLGIIMLAGAPILDGTGSGSPAGMVIMGRLLTAQQLSRIGIQAQAHVSMDATPGTVAPGAAGDRIAETPSTIQVERGLGDIYGNPLLTLRIEEPREITDRGRRAVTYASAYLIVAGIAALMMLFILLNRTVLARLAAVTRHAVSVGDGTDPVTPLDLPGKDEISVLARDFDRMVERVADSRRQLVDQSFQAGFAELSRGVLHNLGNAMTPLGVRLERLGACLREVPAADLERAAGELAGGAPDPARRADLCEFLRLGSRELNSSLAQARDDMEVIQRQVVIVQTALSELMRSTHGSHVLEPVRLPELVSQTLEIVPDGCRQRLSIEADESLRRVGVVQVARTVLRLILQNFIINAADAVRDAGRDTGVLKLAAEVVSGAGGDQLHLHCADDGAGIAEGDLERVFEKGFSTKSRDTNHGIGLHWCANAAAALGGRIWAASAGPGRGASLHLMLPLAKRPPSHERLNINFEAAT